jgi:hypothetical protein
MIPKLFFALLAGFALHLDQMPFAWVSLVFLFLGWIAEIGSTTTRKKAELELARAEADRIGSMNAMMREAGDEH